MAEPKKKVCIVGTASSKTYTPFEDSSYEFWGVNNLFFVQIPNMHYDRWFDIHPIEFDVNKNIWTRRGQADFRGQKVDDYLKDLAKLDVPVYMRRVCSEVPKSLEYPIDDIVKYFGGLNYLTNTIALEVALAIQEGFEEIAIYGVDMGIGTEYGSQRPSVELYIGMALA